MWSCVYSFEFKQEGRDFCGSGTGPDGCLSPAPSFWEEELTCASSAPCPCLCLPAVWLVLHSSQLLSLYSLLWQPLSVSPHSALLVTQGHSQAHVSAAACAIICALTSCEHLKLAVEWRESGLFWVPQVNAVCIFPKKYLKGFGPQLDNY